MFRRRRSMATLAPDANFLPTRATEQVPQFHCRAGASPHGNVQLLHDMQRLACAALFRIENTCRGVGLLQDQVVLRLLVTGCNGNVQTEELP